MSAPPHRPSLPPRNVWLLAGALLLLVIPVWIEPAGSWFGEPDEARYAEIPREMLASSDFVTPQLNGVPYLEKPPLLYWANSASIAAFGQTPWAARLPTRLAGVGTVLLIVCGVSAGQGWATGLTAGIFYLAGALGFVFSRVNLTDGLLTFFFTATLLAARRTLQLFSQNRPARAWSVLTGAAAAGGFLTKGLVALVLPGVILAAWCLLTGQRRWIRALLLAPAPWVWLALTAPWFIAAQNRNPDFSRFFFIHEHFQRFATGSAHRAGPIYYFAGVFLAGFLPVLPFFFASVARPIARWREDAEALFFLIWFTVVFLFFSLSSSKLPPYLMPAIPAAAAMAARAASRDGNRRLWRVAALAAILLVAGLALWPTARRWIADYRLLPIATGGAAILVAGALFSGFGAKAREHAIAAFAVGWFGFNAAVALAWPRVPPATELHDFERVARDSAAASGALVVGYRSYIQGLPWELGHPVPVVDYTGELEPAFAADPQRRDALFWSGERFWGEWKSSRRILAVVSRQDFENFRDSRLIFESRKYVLVANF